MNTQKRLKTRFDPRLGSLLVGVCVYVALLAMLIASITPEQYDLRVGQVSPVTITASRDVEDTLATQQMVDAAVAAVQPTYISDSDAQQTVMRDLSGAFDTLEEIRLWQMNPADMTDEMKNELTRTLDPVALEEETLAWLMRQDWEGLNALRSWLLEAVDETLTNKLSEGLESEAVAKIIRNMEIEQFGSEARDLSEQLLKIYIKPNLLLDQTSIEERQAAAAAAVEPVIYLKGRNIVRSGEIVTKAQYAMLESLGMLKSKGRTVDLMAPLGLGLILLLLMLVVIIYMYVFEREMLEDSRRVCLLGVICVIAVGVCVLSQQVNVNLMPVTLGVMLTTLLLKDRLALIVNIALAVLCGLTASGVSGVFTASIFSILLTSLVSGSLCIAIMRRHQQRVALLLTGLAVGAFNVVTGFAVSLIGSTGTTASYAWMGWSAGSGLLAAVLCIGLQPALEWIFNLVTSAKLLELSNPNQPLIRRLILEASGTYHHSIIVANLAEAAANSIGANGLLARVGAYYHDIGKLKRPLYFKENQIGENPHDSADPMVSAAILTAHPRDGVQLAQKNRIPKPIQDIIEQHHGDTPVVYFYDRYVKLHGKEAVDIENFRYAGPRPRTKEAAIVMMADSVEAAARSMPDPSVEKMEELIRRLIRGKMDDGQLSDCPLTMRDLERVRVAFLTVMTGAFHERVEYPQVEIPRKVAEPIAPPPPPQEEKSAVEQAMEDLARAAGQEAVVSAREEDRPAAPESPEREAAPAALEPAQAENGEMAPEGENDTGN